MDKESFTLKSLALNCKVIFHLNNGMERNVSCHFRVKTMSLSKVKFKQHFAILKASETTLLLA